MFFTSDNTAPVAPQIMAALTAANTGWARGYGNDDLSLALDERVSAVFDRKAKVFLVPTGTAANALALAASVPPWGAVLCHETAHIEEDECGAPEFFSNGAKLRLIPSAHGRITADGLRDSLREAGARGVHQVQPKLLSLTQATEAGTIYTPAQLTELASIARTRGLRVHLDGARLGNAIARLGCTPAQMVAAVDLLSLGATKNGAMAAEAVVCFDPSLHEELAFRRKRAGHLLSKMRYVAAQMTAWLEGDLWLKLAAEANAKADRLAAGLRARGIEFLHPPEANILFVRFSRAQHRALRAAGAQYYLEPAAQDENGDSPDVTARLVCSWCSSDAEIAAFLTALT